MLLFSVLWAEDAEAHSTGLLWEPQRNSATVAHTVDQLGNTGLTFIRVVYSPWVPLSCSLGSISKTTYM